MHTAGPWKIHGQFDAEVTVEILSGDPDGDYITVCELEPFTGDWSDEEIANASLIAAAPDLLGACRAAEVELNTYLGDLSRILPIIREVIAKAEGRV